MKLKSYLSKIKKAGIIKIMVKYPDFNKPNEEAFSHYFLTDKRFWLAETPYSTVNLYSNNKFDLNQEVKIKGKSILIENWNHAKAELTFYSGVPIPHPQLAKR